MSTWGWILIYIIVITPVAILIGKQLKHSREVTFGPDDDWELWNRRREKKRQRDSNGDRGKL